MSEARTSAAEEVQFPVEVPGFRGGLAELVQRAQRGEVDIAEVPVATITREFRERVAAGSAGGAGADPREIADFLTLAARLVSLKAARLLPDGSIDAPIAAAGDEDGELDDPGRRLAEYRLFRAAAEALLAEAAEEGMRSFLGVVSAEVVPAERLSIAPERLAAAFRAVLERLAEPEELGVETPTFSVADKVAELRALLAERSTVRFEEVFAGSRSRLEAVASFLALLEMVKAGEARVDQAGPFDDILVRRVGRAA